MSAGSRAVWSYIALSSWVLVLVYFPLALASCVPGMKGVYANSKTTLCPAAPSLLAGSCWAVKLTLSKAQASSPEPVREDRHCTGLLILTQLCPSPWEGN